MEKKNWYITIRLYDGEHVDMILTATDINKFEIAKEVGVPSGSFVIVYSTEIKDVEKFRSLMIGEEE